MTIPMSIQLMIIGFQYHPRIGPTLGIGRYIYAAIEIILGLGQIYSNITEEKNCKIKLYGPEEIESFVNMDVLAGMGRVAFGTVHMVRGYAERQQIWVVGRIVLDILSVLFMSSRTIETLIDFRPIKRN